MEENRKLKRKLDDVECTTGQDQFHLITTGIKKIKKWSNESIAEGLRCRFTCGYTAYEAERKKRFLPSSRTLRERMQELHFESGVLGEILDLLKYKVGSIKDANRHCALVFDEMAIQPGENFCNNLKKFVGKITLPGHEGLANHVMVFMLVGLRSRWKQVIGYFYTGDSIQHGTIKSILYDIIRRTESCGFQVHAVVSDCSGNLSFCTYNMVVRR